MIRIDEIYNSTFWPFVSRNIPDTRMFFCDPPGRADPDSLYNHGGDSSETNYILFHDQEPIHMDVHQPLFDEVVARNLDLGHDWGPKYKAVITSEHDSDAVRQVCSQYGWYSYYYFFHGWAALDWYRGYNHSFLMPDPRERDIKKSFISPNRIVGGKRDHRLALMYHLLAGGGTHNALISFPQVCPAENVPVTELVKPMQKRYPDIVEQFKQAGFPWDFPGETGHPMHSCWLSLFDECAESLAHVVTETVYAGRRHHLTEKIFKPICLRMPFVLVSTAGSLEYLRSYGFQTFDTLWDESYDLETDDDVRIQKIAKLLLELDAKPVEELKQLHEQAQEIVQHNYDHFYNGNFEDLLWKEFDTMLRTIRRDFNT